MNKEQIQKLITEAVKARKKAYAPYSHFSVGAALLTKEGKIFTGCNVESKAFAPSICAERVAIVKAVSQGYREFSALAIVGALAGHSLVGANYCYPCGVCRELINEFCDSKFTIIVAKDKEQYQQYTLANLLPHPFDG